jgi:phosphonate transport system ATP-binding protein
MPLEYESNFSAIPTHLLIRGLVKVYPDGTQALHGVNMDVHRGELVAVVGLSGAGKSTLLRCINRLVDPSAGAIIYYPVSGEKQVDVTGLQGIALRKYRAKVGMIFQHFNLVPRLSVLQNVLAGGLSRISTMNSIMRKFPPEDIDKALAALRRVGIVGKAWQRAADLSGGQMQRVGIARALFQEPEILLADEPVASLDPATSRDILNYLRTICVEDGLTLIINLHSVELVRKFCERAVGFRDGLKVYDGKSADLGSERYKEIYGVEEER